MFSNSLGNRNIEKDVERLLVEVVASPSLGDLDFSYKLAAAVSATDTTLDLNKAIPNAGASDLYLIIDPFTTECEIRKATIVIGATYTVSAFTYAHAKDDPVFWTEFPYVNVKWFGAKGDGSTDDLISINRATTAASETTGAAMIVELPPGTYLVSDTVNIPNKVIVRGAGPIARTGAPGATIKAMSGFSGSYVVQLGDDASNSVYCRLENLGVDGNHICDVGIYSNSINEESGILRCTVVECDTYGIHMDNSVTGLLRNFLMRDLYVLNDTGGVGNTAIGVYYHGGSSPQRGIDGLTVDVNGGPVCLQIDACQGAVFERIHIEDAADGILIGPNTGCHACSFIGITGTPDLTDLVHISNATTSSNLTFISMYANGSNVLNDAVTGNLFTGDYIGIYTLGTAESTGGNRFVIDEWWQDNIAASQSGVILGRFGESGTYAPKAWFAPRAGSLLGVAVKSNAARSAGTLTIEVFKNFSIATSLQAQLDGTNTQFHSTYQKRDTDGFVAGDFLTVKITTDSAWAPTTADIRVMIEVEM